MLHAILGTFMKSKHSLHFFKGSLQQPKTVLEALEQRLEKYKTAAAQAKSSGDDRKSRMHERIAKVMKETSVAVQKNHLDRSLFFVPLTQGSLGYSIRAIFGLQTCFDRPDESSDVIITCTPSILFSLRPPCTFPFPVG